MKNLKTINFLEGKASKNLTELLGKSLSMTLFGLNGIWIAVLISHFAATIAAVIYCRKLLSQKAKVLAMQ